MSSRTKILVFHAKELIYTAIFAALAIILIILFTAMFRGEKKKDTAPASTGVVSYTPGIYTSTLGLGSQSYDVLVTVDHNRITSIELQDLSAYDTNMYPLMEPTLRDLREQILNTQSLQSLDYSADKKYTAYVLLHAIQSALEKAAAKEN